MEGQILVPGTGSAQYSPASIYVILKNIKVPGVSTTVKMGPEPSHGLTAYVVSLVQELASLQMGKVQSEHSGLSPMNTFAREDFPTPVHPGNTGHRDDCDPIT